jgi:hypothetical protein
MPTLLPSSNTDKVSLTTRASLGAQPDNTQGGASPDSSSGGTPPTGPAGGDLTGSYPDPTLAGIGGGAIGPIGDASHVATVTRDAKGRVSALTSTAITGRLPTGGTKYSRLAKNSATDFDAGWYGPGWYNVKDYGATGDGSTDDTTAINLACTAAAAAHGTAYFPDGVYKVTAAITLTMTGSCSIRGNGRFSSVILCATGSVNAIYCDLSGGTPKQNRVEVSDLGFRTASSTSPTCAVYVDYGAANIASSENQGGSVVTRLEIWNNSSDSGGYAFGVIMRNAWHSLVADIYGYGSSTTYGSSTAPGVGDGGAGSGALVSMRSGVNFTIDNIRGDFWSQAIQTQPVSQSTSGQTQVPQGVTITNINQVECQEGIHMYSNAANDGYDGTFISDIQIDNGNVSLSAHRGLYLLGNGGNGTIANCLLLMKGGIACLELNYCSSMLVTNVIMAADSTAVSALILSGNSNGNQFSNCNFGALPISLSAGSGTNILHGTSGSTVSDSGTSNLIGDTITIDKVLSITGGANSQDFSIDISRCGLAAKAPGFPVQIVDPVPTTMRAAYKWSSGSNSATNAVVTIFLDSGNLSATTVRIGGCVGPGVNL